METNSKTKCAHAACRCTVPAGKKYCSDRCEQQSGAGTHAGKPGRCDCGHPGCNDAR